MIVEAKDLKFNDKKLFMIIAGVPGIGKTTLALSAPKPLLIDLDKGISRVDPRYRKATCVVNNYDELVNDLRTADLSNYETIVIDTGGKLFDLIKPIVIKEDYKNGKRDGNLSLQGYGASKKKFSDFVKFVKSLDKHLIVVFHASEVQLANDITGLRIRLEGSSKDDIWDDVDIGGFVEIVNGKRTIGFSNCERYYAKATHGIKGVMEIPSLEKNSTNDFVSKLFKKIIDDLNEETDEFNLYQNVINELKDEIAKAKTLEDLNNEFTSIANKKHYLTSKEEAWAMLQAKAKELGFNYDKATKQFK
jgi:hypothetical protein